MMGVQGEKGEITQAIPFPRKEASAYRRISQQKMKEQKKKNRKKQRWQKGGMAVLWADRWG